MDTLRSKAARALSTGQASEEDIRSLAGAVLGDDSLTPPPAKTREDLERILSKIDGQEGQAERAALIRAQLADMG